MPVEVVAPNADRYMDRKEVAVSPVESTTDHLDLVFPEVKSITYCRKSNQYDYQKIRCLKYKMT
ncbi:MAG: hypothetical protein ACLUPK_04600 [Veillonella sp.]